MRGVASSAVHIFVIAINTCHTIDRQCATRALSHAYTIYQVRAQDTSHTCGVIT